MKIAHIEVFRYTLPLRSPLPLPNALLYERQGLLLRLIGENGKEGWGESAPLPGFSRETLPQAQEALVRCAKILSKHPFPSQINDLEELGLLEPLALPSVSFAVEVAALSLRAAMAETPLCHTIKANLSDTILINALLTGTVEEILVKARELGARGYRAAKLKVGRGGIEEEMRLVHEVREALGSDIALRLDANQAWDLETAVNFARQVADCDIEYIEEPLSDPWHLPLFRQESDVPYALDETLYHSMLAVDGGDNVSSFYQLCNGVAAAVLKPTFLHMPGFAGLLGTVGLPARKTVVSAAYESGIGIAALAHYAAVFSGPDVPAGLDTYERLAEDVLAERLPIDGGVADINAIDAAARTIDTNRLTRIWAGGA